VVRKYLEEKGITWTTWDYQGGFGLFKKGTSELFDYDLDTDILKSLNFNIPAQSVLILTPESKPIDIYTDYIGQSVFESGSAGNGTIDYYSSDAQAGKYSIYWTGSNQYSGPGFDFKPDKDFSQLIASNYELDFWVKGDTPGTKFQIRFVDSKSAAVGDHPWRISYDIDQTKVTWNGTWQQLKIPLKSFKETGSWDSSWFNPEGKFDWKAVDRLEIIAESNALGTQKIWFDEIRINGTPITSTAEQLGIAGFKAKAYPNPFSVGTTIEYILPESGDVEVSIFDLTGRKIATLFSGLQNQGEQQLQWVPEKQGSSKSISGVYVCRIKTSGKTEVLKLVLKGE
jgi:endoglucanase